MSAPAPPTGPPTRWSAADGPPERGRRTWVVGAVVVALLVVSAGVGALAMRGSDEREPDPVIADALEGLGTDGSGADDLDADGPAPTEDPVAADVPDGEPAGSMDARQLAEVFGDAVWLVEADGCGFESAGTAFAIDDRLLVTNWHVTVNDTDPTIVSRDGDSTMEARVVGWSEQPDLAILEVDADLPVSLEWAPASDLGEGQDLVALGYPVPAGDFTVTRATVMSFQTEGSVRQAIRADGLLDKGNSGGPALTDDGRVAGVVTEMALSEGFQLVPLLYTHDHLQDTIDELLDERPGATADCDALGERPMLPDEWEWGGDDVVAGADAYGDDAELDTLWEDCDDGDLAACDDLYFRSAIGSSYEAFGASCGDRGSGYGTCELFGPDGATDFEAPTLDDADTYGDDAELDDLWDDCEEGDLSACDELFLLSPLGSEYESYGLTCGDREEPAYGTCELSSLDLDDLEDRLREELEGLFEDLSAS